MAEQKVGRTALGAAVCRLIEQSEPEEKRLFADPVVAGLVGAPIRFLLRFASMRAFTRQQTDAVAAGIYGAQVCRTRYIDDAVQQALAEGTGQLAILGAGLDTRPYRLPGIEWVKVYEVDLPGVQAGKLKQLQKQLGRLPENVTYLPVDLDRQPLEEAFARTDFDPSRPAAFIWEGVTQYITEAAVRRTLTFVGNSAPGSLIVFTYVLKSIIERRSDVPGADRLMDQVAQGSPWIFGLEPAEVRDFLQLFHLDLLEDVGSADYEERYLRPMGRQLVVSAGERIVKAVVERV